MLVVIGIIVVLMALMGPAMNALKGANDVTKTAYDIAGILEQSRSYAMANNTFVWVGFQENDITKPSVAGVGLLAVAVVASKDGTVGYDINTPSTWAGSYVNGVAKNLTTLGKVQQFENVHLAPLFSTIPNQGGTKRPTVSSGSYQLGNTTSTPNPSKCVTPFEMPLGKGIDQGDYHFKRVINFDPQGVARIRYSTDPDAIVEYMEIGLQQTHGNVVSGGPNVAAIQLDCMTGSVHIYRP